MTFLPIVERELRAAARRRSTFRIRSWTAVAAMVLALLWLMMANVGPNRAGVGATVFNALTFYAFGLSLLAGVFLTADSLSEEKREGTLGLLFLTDLKGYDVVLGKFMATSLNAFYGLMALLPVAALPLLLGGVTGGEFWRMALALMNALFFSLAVGIGISALMVDSQRAVGNTLGLLLLVGVLLPIFETLLVRMGVGPAWRQLTWFSPYGAFASASAPAYASDSRAFWGSLLTCHLLAWGFLALASLVLPHSWQTRAIQSVTGSWLGRRLALNSNGSRRAPRRPELLSENPVLWLLSDQERLRWGMWLVVLVWALVVFAFLLFSSSNSSADMGWSVAIPFGLLLKLLVAFQASRFFAEARRSGALELLLCTPLTSRDLVQGQTLSLWRTLLWPVTAFLSLLLLPGLLQTFQAVFRDGTGQFSSSSHVPFLTVFYSIRMLADLAAICQVGMWLGLSSKKNALVPAQTILFVLVLPTMVCWLDFVVDLILISWASSRLNQDLRRLLTEQYQPVFTPAAPPSRRLPPVMQA